MLVAMLVLVASVSAAQYPRLEKYVNDFADVLDPPCEAKLNAVASAVEQNSTAEIAIVTVQDLGGSDVDTYANELFRSAGAGSQHQYLGVNISI